MNISDKYFMEGETGLSSFHRDGAFRRLQECREGKPSGPVTYLSARPGKAAGTNPW